MNVICLAEGKERSRIKGNKSTAETASCRFLARVNEPEGARYAVSRKIRARATKGSEAARLQVILVISYFLPGDQQPHEAPRMPIMEAA
jgi:hypothetical protein